MIFCSANTSDQAQIRLGTVAQRLAHRGPLTQPMTWDSATCGFLSADQNGIAQAQREGWHLFIVGRPNWTEFKGDIRTRLERWAERALDLFLSKGPDGFLLVGGDFAVVLYHPQQKILWAARDPLGKKTLAYRQIGPDLVLASEAQALAALSPRSSLNQLGLALWLVNHYPDPVSQFDNVHYVPPGSALKWANQRLAFHTYFRFQDWKMGSKPLSPERVSEAIFNAVGNRIPPEENRICCHLSGGMDSSSVTATAALSGLDVRAYQFWFPHLASCDETHLSDQVVAQYGLSNFKIDTSQWGLFAEPKDPAFLENPFFGWDQVDTQVFKDMPQHSLWLLTGQFGDNLWGGWLYPAFWADRILKGKLRFGAALMQDFRKRKVKPARSLYRLFLACHLPQSLKLGLRKGLAKTPYCPTYLSKETYRKYHLDSFLLPAGNAMRGSYWNALYRQLFVDVGGIRRAIHWYERLAAPYGVRVEHPFFDLDLVRLVWESDPSSFLDEPMPKGILRKAMVNKLPAALLHQHEKPDLRDFYHAGLLENRSFFEAMGQLPKLSELGLLDSNAYLDALEQYYGQPNTTRSHFMFAAGAELFVRRHLEADNKKNVR
ncbi:MAG: hypothetical protein H6510_01440 [Acidobacteria bacterium]|nr:hypothetical protein [Acidobacteriota bacterium]